MPKDGMITHRQYLRGEEEHATLDEVHDAEVRALNELANFIALAMKDKAHFKLSEGYRGWDDPDLVWGLRAKLREHVERALEGRALADPDPEQLIDVILLSAFLINISKETPAQREERAGAA